MKKIISVTLLIALTMTLISGCGGSANANEIRIGINYELSGEVAWAGFS